MVTTEKEQWSKLPETAKKALAEAGNIIPKMAVLDPSVTTNFGSISYNALHDARAALRTPKKKAKEWFEAEAAKGTSASASETALETWTSADGKAITAKFRGLSEGKVSLELATGATVPVPLDRLAEASRKRAQELAAK
jgi:hypothetical protein